MGRKLGACSFGGGGAGSPFKTMWPGPRPTCVPSFILIHPTVWPQYTNVYIFYSFFLCTRPTQYWFYLLYTCIVSGQSALMHFNKWNETPASQTGQIDRQDRQRSDSVGRTVLQTVAQKVKACFWLMQYKCLTDIIFTLCKTRGHFVIKDEQSVTVI